MGTFHPRFGVSTITGGTIPFQKDLSPSCLYIFTMQSPTWKVPGIREKEHVMGVSPLCSGLGLLEQRCPATGTGSSLSRVGASVEPPHIL